LETFLQQLINGLSLGAIYALIALGYTMVYGVLRLINFAHGDVYMLGAFAGYYLANALALDTNPSLLGAIAVTLGAMGICALVGIVIERFAYRPVRQHSRLTSLITAIGVSLLLEYGGQVVFGATSFRSSTSWRQFDTVNREDEDGTNLIGTYFDTANIEANESFYQEFKFSGKTASICSRTRSEPA